MNAAAPKGEWSRAQWGVLVGLLIALQAGVLHRWGRIPSPGKAREKVGPTLVWLTDEVSRGEMEWAPWIPSPRKFVELEDGAFAHVAERALPRTAYQLMTWDFPARWLDNGSGTWFPRLPDPDAAVAASPSGQFGRLGSGAVPLPRRTGGRLEVEGTGTVRRLRKMPETLPEWRGVEMVGPSRVEVLVGSGGNVLSARLRETCGVRSADEAALALARETTFIPLAEPVVEPPWNPEGLQWIRLVFRWRTLPALNTNAPPAATR